MQRSLKDYSSRVQRRGQLIVRLIAIAMLWDSLVCLSLPCSRPLALRLVSSSYFDIVLHAPGLDIPYLSQMFRSFPS